jgi:hypothetical protein
VAGALLLTAGVAALVLGAAGPDPLVLVAGAVVLAAFAFVERRARRPLVARSGWRDPRLRAGAAASFLNTATTSSALTLAALGLHDPAAAGLALLPFSVGVVAGSALAPRLFPAHRAAAVGLGAIAAGSAALVAAPVAVAALVAGAGLGVASVGATALGTNVPAALQGAAVGVLNTAAQLGTALGIAALLALAAAAGDAVAWLSAAALAVVGASALTRLPRQGPGQTSPRNA